MFGWLKGKNSRPSAQADEDAALPSEREDAADRGRFMLEALEPRILLSADPVLGELARWVSEDDSEQQRDDLAVIYEQLDSATEASIAAVTSTGDSPSAQESSSSDSDASGPLIEWPAEWLGEDENAPQASAGNGVADEELPAVVPVAEREQAVESQRLQAANTEPTWTPSRALKRTFQRRFHRLVMSTSQAAKKHVHPPFADPLSAMLMKTTRT